MYSNKVFALAVRRFLFPSVGLLLLLSACVLLTPSPPEPTVQVVPTSDLAPSSESRNPTEVPHLPSENAPPPTAGLPVIAACNPPLPRTVANPEGPFYRPNAPERTNLVPPGMPGTRLVVFGLVLTPDCRPVPGALLDFWQTDAEGNYDNQGFQLRGRQYADETGQFRLETILPGVYPGRPPHIHVKVNPPEGAVLTTQIYFSMPAATNSDVSLHPSLVTDVRFDPDGVLQAEFNFVLHP